MARLSPAFPSLQKGQGGFKGFGVDACCKLPWGGALMNLCEAPKWSVELLSTVHAGLGCMHLARMLACSFDSGSVL